MKYIFYLLGFVFITSCVSVNRYSKIVKTGIQEIYKPEEDIQSSKIVVDLKKLESFPDTIASSRVKFQIIPALVYWQWNNTIKCELDPLILGKIYENNFYHQSKTLGLLNKLGEKQLEITIEKVPNSFVYIDKGYSIILLVAYSINALEAIYPESQNLEISYKLIENDKIIKQGQLYTKEENLPLKNNWTTTTELTWLYLDQYKENTVYLTKDIIYQLLVEI